MQTTSARLPFFISSAIILGMLGIYVADVALQGYAATIVTLLSFNMIFFSLVANVVIHHAQIMESDAPGARIYQRIAIVIYETALAKNIAPKHEIS